jgi:hypothetical protein
MRSLLLLPALAFIATGANAQDWSYQATLYGWLPGLSGSVDTRFGTIDFEPEGGGDSMIALKAGFLGTFTARRGPFSLTADVLYASLEASGDAPLGLLYSGATVSQDLMAISGYGFYRVVDTPQTSLDLGAGFRSFDLALGVELGGEALPPASQDIDASWTDPLLAARVGYDISDRWFVHGFADWGGTLSGDRTWQAYGGLGYRFNDNWSTELGYRHMEIAKKVGGARVDLALDGGQIAVSYSF